MALEYTSSPDKEKKKKVGGKKKVVIVDTEHLAESEARDAADAKMTANAESMKGVSGFFKRIWKHGIARDYYHQKEIVDAKKAIYENENIYAGVDTDKAYHDGAMEAVVSRFTHEYADEVVSRGAGEKIKTLDKYDQATKELNTALQELVREYAGGSMSEGAFRESKKRIVREIADTYPGSIDIGKMFADNIFDIAKEAKDAVDHGVKINELDLDFEIVLGKAKSSIRSEAKFTTADTIMQRLKEKAPLLSSALLNETSIASLVAIGMGVGSSLLRSKVATWVTFGGSALVASALSGLRESKKVKEDRRQHGRERAKGQTFEAGAKQREQMEESQYDMIDATKVTKEIEALFYTKNSEGEDVVRTLTEDEQQQLLGMIVDLEARAVLAEQRKIDLISYSDTRNVENERTQLDLLRAKVKAEFRRRQGRDEFDAFIDLKSMAETRRLLGGEAGIEAKDKIFNKMKAKKVGLAMGRTLLAGVAIGGIAQEILSIGGDKVQGVGEGVAGMFTTEDTVTTAETAHLTPLEKLRQFITGDDIRMGSELYTTEIAGNPVKAPEGIEFVGQADGSVDITRYGETIADDVKLNFNPDGTLAPESIDMLQSEYNIGAESHIDQITTQEVASHTPGEHVALHGEDMQQVSRNMWYDNNTPKPVFDLNELKLWWGGENNVGLDANGNYIFTVEHLNSSGSFHESFSVDAQEKIANGGLKMIFSLSEDTQNYVYQVPIDINGHAIIDPNSEIGKIFFKEVNGQVVFLGKFAEVAESLGEQKGVESVNLLATHVGDGIDAIAGPESVTKDVPVTIFDMPADDTVDWPPFIPVVGRRPLEPMVPGQAKKPESKNKLAGVPYYGMGSAKDAYRELRENGADVDTYFITYKEGKPVYVNKEGKLVSRDVVREQKRVKEYLNRQDPEYIQELTAFNESLEPMREECRVAVIIPARFEAKNLSNLLDQYVKQVDENGNPLSKDLFEINIIVNRRIDESPDDSVKVIEEWKKKNPGYHVNTIDVVFPKDKANVGVARKYITDLSLKRSLERVKAKGPLYIESEDADLFSVDKRTIAKIIGTLDEKPQLDVLRGIQDRQPEIMQKNHLFFFTRRLWDMAEAFMRKEAYRPEHMAGSNFVWNRIISGGWNTAFSAEVYTQIGGYVPDVIGEDMKIGQKISVLRGYEKPNGDIAINTKTASMSGLRSNSSPRRFLDAAARNISPYDDFDNQSLKEKSIDELMDSIKEYGIADVSHLSRYQEAINILVSSVNSQIANPPVTREIILRTLRYMGLKEGQHFSFDGKSVQLIDAGMEQVISLMDEYQKKGKANLGYRRQNRPTGA